jgi:hypothetical protein
MARAVGGGASCWIRLAISRTAMKSARNRLETLLLSVMTDNPFALGIPRRIDDGERKRAL